MLAKAHLRLAVTSAGSSVWRSHPCCSKEDVVMRTALDFSPLYRSTVGFDRLFNLLDTTMGADATSANWPPYNIERLGEDQYRITMAVAGFTPEEINLVQQENTLLVE